MLRAILRSIFGGKAPERANDEQSALVEAILELRRVVSKQRLPMTSPSPLRHLRAVHRFEYRDLSVDGCHRFRHDACLRA